MSLIEQNFLIDSMNASPGLISKTPSSYTTNGVKYVSDYKIETLLIDREATIKITRNTALPESASVLSQGSDTWSMKIKEKNIAKLQHDFVLYAVTGNWPHDRDQPLENIAKIKDSETNVLSPDYIALRNKQWMVMELKTRFETNVSKTYSEAFEKYAIPLKIRAEKKQVPIHYYILVVSRNSIHTNLELSEAQCEGLWAHFKLGRHVIESFQSQGYVLPGDDMQKEIENRYMEQLMMGRSVNYFLDKHDLNRFPYMNEDYISSCGPIDLEHVKRTFKSCMSKACDDILRRSDFRQVGEFVNKLKSHKRRDQKAIFQVPMPLGCRKGDEFPSLTGYSPMIDIWSQAIGYARTSFEELLTVDQMKDKAINPQPLTQKELRQYRRRNRVKVELSNSLKEELAMFGFEAKSKRKNPLVQLKKEMSKEPYNWDVDNSDISFFLKSSGAKLFEQSEKPLEETSIKLNDLMTEALNNSIYQDRNFYEMQNLFLEFSRTKFGDYMYTFDQIIQEVNLSLNQYCAGNELVLKQVSNMSLWVLCRTTGPDNKIFYSVASKATDYFPLSKKMQGSDWCVSDFVSLDRHRIGHYLHALEKAFAYFVFTCETFKVDPQKVLDNPAENLNVIEHFLLIMTVFLEAKQQTSASLQQIRYAYMEATRQMKNQDPLKIIGKWDDRPKSRFLIYVYRSAITNFLRMSSFQPKIIGSGNLKVDTKANIRRNKPEWLNEVQKVFDKMDAEDLRSFERPAMKSWADEMEAQELEDIVKEGKDDLHSHELSGDNFVNLLSWVNGTQIRHLKQALELSYLGSIHNRDEGDQSHGALKIFTKVISQELLMRNLNQDYTGKLDTDEPTDHTFSITFLKSAAKELRTKLRENRSEEEFNTSLKQSMLNKVRKQNLEHYSTFKASAKTPTKMYEHNVKARGASRIKALLGFKQLAESGLIGNYPLLDVEKVTRELEDQGTIYVNLFKKNQIGGAREIFVLEPKARLAISFVETVSRCLCERLEGEMLSKGSTKLKHTKDFFSRISKEKRERLFGFDLLCTNSDDAKTWCQKFIMRQFGIMFSEILEPRLLSLVMRILNLVTAKKLELPYSLLDIFVKNPGTNSYDSEINELREQFLGVSQNKDLISEPYSKLMNNESNMMQGILHFTSSLYHYMIMNYIDKVVHAHYSLLKNQNIFPEKENLITDFKVSSDDSSYSMCFISREPLTAEHAKFLSKMSYFKKHLLKQFNVELSHEKSTSSSFSCIEEFNSMWFVSNTMMMPCIKFLYSSLMTPPSYRLDDRQIQMSETRKQLLANGCSIGMTHATQLMHFRIHYKNLGCDVNRLFPTFSKELVQKPHPGLGFFLFEPSRLTGLFGYDFAFYCFMSGNSKSRKIEDVLTKRGDMEFSEFTGKNSITHSFIAGSRRRYLEFIAAMKIDDTWSDDMAQKEEPLFRKSQSLDESLFWINKKALTPSSAEAFSFEATNRMHVSGVYILQEPVVYERTMLGKGSEVDKKSLLRAIMDLPVSEEEIKPLYINMIFPCFQIYDLALYELRRVERSIRVPRIKQRAVELHSLILPKRDLTTSMSLLSVLRRLWFLDTSKGTKAEFEMCLAYYKEIYPWISDTVVESKDKSPFKDVIALSDFVRSFAPKDKKVFVTAPIKGRVTTQTFIREIIKHNQWPTYTCRTAMDTQPIKNVSQLRTMHNSLNLIMTSPSAPNTRRMKIFQYLKSMPPLVNSSTMLIDSSGFRRHDFSLAILQAAITDKNLAIKMMMALKKGTLGFYQEKGTRQPDGSYKGHSIFRASINGVPMNLIIIDDKLMRVQITDAKSLMPIIKDFLLLMKQLGLTASTSGHYGNFAMFLDTRLERMVTRRSAFTIPIEEPLGGISALHLTDPEFQHKITYEKMELLMEVQRSDMFDEKSRLLVKVLDYSPSLSYFSEDKMSEDPADVYGYWTGNHSLPEGNAIEFLQEALNAKEKGKSLMLDWSISSLKSRASFLGFDETVLSSEPTMIVNVETFKEKTDAEFMDDVTESEFLELLGDVKLLEPEDMNNEFMLDDFAQNYIDKLAVVDERPVHIFSFHRFWDDFLFYLKNERSIDINALLFGLHSVNLDPDLQFLGKIFNFEDRFQPKVKAPNKKDNIQYEQME